MTIDIEMSRIGDHTRNPICISAPKVERRTLPERPDAFLVCQREFGLAKAPQWLRTTGFNTCVITTFYDPASKCGGLAHFDLETDVGKSFQKVVLPAFRQANIPLRRIEVRIIGGIFSDSLELCRKIRDQVTGKMKIKEIDIIQRPKEGLLLDTESGEAHNLLLLTGNRPTDAETLKHYEESFAYIETGNRLLKDVSRPLKF